ncbi:MAG: hypothetical protein Q8N46_10940 [Anaerolineales bacterium]|nr:hypothetical protein [Anaerolineales bacterium]
MIFLYLDPSAGSILFQLLVAALAGLAIFIGASWRKIKRLFNKNKIQNDESDDEDEDD